MNVKLFVLFLLVLIGGGCMDKPELYKPEKYDLKGKVEKGPFVKGSEVKIYELTDKLVPTGKSFNASITDDQGNFALEGVELTSRYVELVASGYFYNEVSGKLSDSQITLRAITDIAEQQTVNINVLTHLKKERLLRLMNEGKTYQEAGMQAQQELLSVFGLAEYADKDANMISMSSGNAEAGALIIISASLLDKRTETEFTEYMSSLSEELKKNGKLSDNRKEGIWKSSVGQNWEDIRKGLQGRYRTLGCEITFPDLNRFVDWNRNGIAGDELGNPDEDSRLSFMQDTLRIGKEGGHFEVGIEANLFYDFTSPGPVPPKDDIVQEGVYDIKPEEIKNTSSLDRERNRLVLDIEPAYGFSMKNKVISLYSQDGRLCTSLVIIQEGNPELFKLSKNMNEVIAGFLRAALTVADLSYTMEAFYTMCYPKSQQPWDIFYEHDVSELLVSEKLANAWGYAYQGIANCNNVLKYLKDQDPSGTYPAIFLNIRAIIYYQLVSLWGNVPYVEKYGDMNPVQLEEDAVCNKIIGDLKEAAKSWPVQGLEKYKYEISADQIQVLLAKMYVKTGKHDEALKLLKGLIQSGRYSFEPDRKGALNGGSRELICGLNLTSYPSVYREQIEDNLYLSFGRYSEVVLLAADCEFQLGNKAQALSYLNEVRSNYQLGQVVESVFEDQLEQTWKEILKGEFSYFAFLKRHHLYGQKLGIKDFQGLFPLPDNEVVLGGGKQNPGY